MSTWLFSTVWAPTTATEGESFLWYKATNRLQVGTALLWKQGAFRGLASYTVAPEKGSLPMITVGAGLQGIGTGNPGYFATAEKTLKAAEGTVNGYLGLGFRANEAHPHMLGGAKFTPTGSPWTLGVQADGHNVHPFITREFPDFTLGVYLVNLKTPGLLVSKRW